MYHLSPPSFSSLSVSVSVSVCVCLSVLTSSFCLLSLSLSVSLCFFVSLSLFYYFYLYYFNYITEFKKSQVKEGSQAHIYPQLRIKGVGFDRTLGGLEMDMRLRDHLAKIFMVRVLQYYESFITMTVPVYLFLCNFFIYFSINSYADYSFLL